MRLVKEKGSNPNLKLLDEMIRAMEKLLAGEQDGLDCKQILQLQSEDGSFGLLDGNDIPKEAIIDFIKIPSYIGVSIVMKEFLKGRDGFEIALKKGLTYLGKVGLSGHGYDNEGAKIKGLKFLIAAGLKDFLEEEKVISPEFNCMIHNILHDYQENCKDK